MNNEQPLPALAELIQQVIAAETDDFLKLVSIAGLNPTEDLTGANLSCTDLSHANLSEADLSWTDLSDANLFEADLRNTNLSRANLRGANLSRANLQGADLSGAINQSENISPSCSFNLFMVPVAAGFPSPAEDYIEAKLDLNQHLIRHPEATFFVRASGDSMIGAGIHSGDLLVVDRAIEPADGSVVIAVVNGELTVKRLCQNGERLLLLPENDEYYPVEINEHTEFQIWGVVTNVIHPL